MSEYRIYPHPDQEGFPGRVTVQIKVNGSDKWEYFTHFNLFEKADFDPIQFSSQKDIKHH